MSLLTTDYLLAAPSTQFLAVADLVTGTQGLYTTGVLILVFGALLAGAAMGVGNLMRGRLGAALGFVLVGVVCAVLIGSSYAIYLSTKKTVDTKTGITSGQFG